jgi:DNA-directed RNA polymerase specialized sigma24 family protein
MDLASALDELPEVHATALRLHRAGTDTAGIAAALGIEVEAVAPLLRVAEAKLASLLAAPTARGGRSGAVVESPDAGHEPGNLRHTRH